MMNEERKQQLKERIEKIVRYHKKLKNARNALDEEFEECAFCVPLTDAIHVFRGIQEMAMAVNENLYTIERNDPMFPYEYYFTYKNIKFFQIGKEL